MAKLWTTDHEVLERGGEFHSLVQVFSSLPASSLPDRANAALARAYAFLGSRPQAERLIRDLKKATLDLESQIVVALAQAHLERLDGQWEKAEFTAARAAEDAAALQHGALLADAEFGLAIAWVELDRMFRGLDLFQRIRNNELLSSYRRGLAALNEAWLLWHMGRFDALEAALPSVPPQYQPRLMLAREMVNGQLVLTEKWFREGLPSFLPQQEKDHALMFLTQSILVLGYDYLRKQIPKSWLYAYWSEQRQNSKNPLLRSFGECFQKLIDKDEAPLAEDVLTHWREKTNLKWMEAFLVLQRKGDVSEFWKSEINPLIERYRLRTPIIPSLTDRGLEPNSPWSLALESRLGLRRATAQDRILTIKEGRLFWGALGKEDSVLDLKRHPTSLNLLKILAGRAGDRISKEVIHQGLTGTRYFPDRHDDRILKLLSRLKKRLNTQRIPEPWTLQGDNKVQLNTDIEVL